MTSTHTALVTPAWATLTRATSDEDGGIEVCAVLAVDGRDLEIRALQRSDGAVEDWQWSTDLDGVAIDDPVASLRSLAAWATSTADRLAASR